MQLHDVFMAVLLGYECLRLGYEYSEANLAAAEPADVTGRFILTGLMVVGLTATWVALQ